MAVAWPSTEIKCNGALTRWAIEIGGLSRRFGTRPVLHNIDLTIPWDQWIGVLGANGAGKTTLIRVLATLVRPTSGRVIIGGLPLPDRADAVRRHVGYVGHQTFLYDELTVRENLEFYGRLYRVPKLSDRIAIVLDRVGVADRAGDRVRTLSRGQQQRVTLARAILHDPPILLLDEPDTGLDVQATELLHCLFVDERGRRRSVVLTTHNVDRAHELVDRVAILRHGHVAFDVLGSATTPTEISEAIREPRGLS
jgi:heme exporter protein A